MMSDEISNRAVREKEVEEKILDIISSKDIDITRDNDVAIVEKERYDYFSGKELPYGIFNRVSTRKMSDVAFDICVAPKDGSGIEFSLGIVNQPAMASVIDLEVCTPDLGNVLIPEGLINSTKKLVLSILEKVQKDIKRKDEKIVPYLNEKFLHIESFLLDY